jgi:predicted dithiol-disulfide oxidoreductase (DUF899 family)
MGEAAIEADGEGEADTRAEDELAGEVRALPRVKVEKSYLFPLHKEL